MKNILFWLITVLLASSCSMSQREKNRAPEQAPQTPSLQGGVGVGNGMTLAKKIYRSPHQFELSYDSQKYTLSVESSAESKVTFRSQEIGSQPGGVASLTVSVLSSPKDHPQFAGSVDAFESWAKRNLPAASLHKRQFPGAIAFGGSVESDATPGGRYYVLTDSQIVLKVEWAHHSQQGAEELEAIFDSFRCDTEAPTLERVIVPQQIEAKDGLVIIIDAKDNLSGISTDHQRIATLTTPDGSNYLPLFGSWIAQANGQFKATIAAMPHIKPGTWKVDEIVLQDKAGNFSSSIPAEATHIEVTNTNGVVDDQAPKVLATSETIEASAGQTAKLKLRIEENGSGVSTQIDLGGWFVWQQSVDSVQEVTIAASGELTSLGDDWYELSFYINEYKPGGMYHLNSLVLSDRAGNFSRSTVSARLVIAANSRADVAAPLVASIKPVGDWKCGKKNFLEINLAQMDQSGIAPYLDYAGTLRHTETNARIPLEGEIRQQSDLAHLFAIAVPRLAPSGSYVLEDFILFDRAENTIPVNTESVRVEIAADR